MIRLDNPTSHQACMVCMQMFNCNSCTRIMQPAGAARYAGFGGCTSEALVVVGLGDAVQQAGVAPRLGQAGRVRRQPRPRQVQRVEQPCLGAGQRPAEGWRGPST